MWYTHYWKREPEIPLQVFRKIQTDFNRVTPVLHRYGVILTADTTPAPPIVNNSVVCFNGSLNCRHAEHEFTLRMKWLKNMTGPVSRLRCRTASVPVWEVACCYGDCSSESFYFPRDNIESDIIKDLGFCRTNLKPYDLAVVCFLIIAKHYLGESIHISSDGGLSGFLGGLLLCHRLLGYDTDFKLEEV